MIVVAWDIHPSYLKAVRSPRNWRGILRHKFRRLINWKRSRQERIVSRRQVSAPIPFSAETDSITSSFEESKDFFHSFGYAYISNFFSDEFHQQVLASWPELPFFRMGSDPSKSYDRGPTWCDESRRTPGVSPTFYYCLQAIASRWFSERVNRYCADGIARSCSSLGSSWARVGSHLLPHKDNAAKHGDNTVVNFIIFVDGTSPAIDSGGTSLFRSNLYSDPLLIPSSLKNTAIIYGTGQQFHHGFPRLKMRKYSKRIIAQFAPMNS
jgi:hypothetical protein